MRVLLVGNYVSDRQESMLRYADLLGRLLVERRVEVKSICPRPIIGRFAARAGPWAKWLGYVDKYFIFPWQLQREVDRWPGCIVHLCDHSNAMYAGMVRRSRIMITCHDLLAVKSALGHFPGHPTRFTGRLLQHWIRTGLRFADRIVCVSEATRRDLVSLEPDLEYKSTTVYNSLNFEYAPMAAPPAHARLRAFAGNQLPDIDQYILHVGGNGWYKNRAGVVRIYNAYVLAGGRLALVMVGPAPTDEVRRLVRICPKGGRVIELKDIDNLTLNALYAAAALLIFPSFEEGFGWPVLEALAVGCAVVCSRRGSLPEVAGPAAFYINPYDEAGAVEILSGALRASLEERHVRRESGFAQVKKIGVGFADSLLGEYMKLNREGNLIRSV